MNDETRDRDDDNGKDHPIGEGVGAAGGAVTGMAIGASVGGPAGAVIGAGIGAAAGGLAGHGIAAAIDPEQEDAYWRDNYQSRPYVTPGTDYDQYRDAYRYGWESRANTQGAWDDVEDDLESGWDRSRTTSRLGWNDAKHAVRDSWDRVERAIPGDADRDGR